MENNDRILYTDIACDMTPETEEMCKQILARLKEPKEAQWIPRGIYAKCSNCGGGVDVYVSKHYKFCPFCGKKMEEYKPYTSVATGDKTASADGTSISGFKTADDINIYSYKVEETHHDD